MTLHQLAILAWLRQMAKNPKTSIDKIKPVKPFKEGNANELTRSIVNFIRLTGNYADRINNTGIFDPSKGVWRKGGTRKGISDIIASKAIIYDDKKFSVIVAIEVKIGADKLSEYQLKIKDEITTAGGKYIVAKSWDDFIKQWNEI